MTTPKPTRKRVRNLSGIPARRGRPPGSSEPFSLIPSNSAAFVTPQQLLAKLERVISLLMEHEMAAPFNQPVDPEALGIPDYPKIIKNPMDLGTIHKKLTSKPCGYKYMSEVVADVRLVWNNCYTFNDVQSEISAMAKVLSRAFENLMREHMDCRIIPETAHTISAEHPGILYADHMEQIASMTSIMGEQDIADESGAMNPLEVIIEQGSRYRHGFSSEQLETLKRFVYIDPKFRGRRPVRLQDVKITADLVYNALDYVNEKLTGSNRF